MIKEIENQNIDLVTGGVTQRPDGGTCTDPVHHENGGPIVQMPTLSLNF